MSIQRGERKGPSLPVTEEDLGHERGDRGGYRGESVRPKRNWVTEDTDIQLRETNCRYSLTRQDTGIVKVRDTVLHRSNDIRFKMCTETTYQYSQSM